MVFGIVLAIMTLLVGGAAVMGADFGLPMAWGLPAALWLLTAGLPSTVAVVVTAACWGRWPGGYGLVRFMAVAVLMACSLQTLTVNVFLRWRRART